MASYDYVCEKEHVYTEVRSIHEDQIQTICPEENCGLPLKRVYTATASAFKGKGFYSNDKNHYLLKKGQHVDY